MKRVLVSLVFLAIACHPQEPKQASAVDPTTDDSSNGGGGSGSGGGSGGGGSSGSGKGDNIFVPPPAGGGGGGAASGGKAGKGATNEPTVVTSLSSVTEGVKWGISHAEVTKIHTENGGIIWKDYDEKLAKARVGPEMTALEAEREQAKAAFARSFIEFKDTPTGYDATGIKGEYTYKNRESLMWVNRQGKKRYFFFINDRLWKVYDEVPLHEGGPLGKSYIDAVNKMNAQLGAQGRIQGVDPAKGVTSTTVDWKDGTTHLRVVDRSAGDKVVGVVMEDNATLGNLASLRSNKSEDPTAIDPTIAAVTKGGLSDPNAAKTPETATSGKKPGTKPPPKK